ncbi:MAG: hypothetical protein K6C94_06970 [Candidatus Gastranaerophilales bacterium]|nr:hypothetical protein [Candidatus Gastranaerophilales bacterium]
MLLCCGRQFFAAEKVVLPKKDKLYRCLEFGFCPNCSTRVSRLIEQDKNYEITVKERRGIKALRAYEKAVAQRNRFLKQTCLTGSKTSENFYFGDFRKTKRLDENNQPIFLQLKKNFNNKTEVLGEVTTYYYKI